MVNVSSLLAPTKQVQNNLVPNFAQHIKIFSFTGTHEGVESPSEGMSIENGFKDNKKTSGDLIKEGDLNDPGQKDDEEKYGNR